MIETREIIDLMERVERINNPYTDYCQHHLTSLSAGEWNDSFVREFESKSPSTKPFSGHIQQKRQSPMSRNYSGSMTETSERRREQETIPIHVE